MPIKIGSTDLADLKIGTDQIARVYVGDQIAWENIIKQSVYWDCSPGLIAWDATQYKTVYGTIQGYYVRPLTITVSTSSYIPEWHEGLWTGPPGIKLYGYNIDTNKWELFHYRSGAGSETLNISLKTANKKYSRFMVQCGFQSSNTPSVIYGGATINTYKRWKIPTT